MQNKYRENLFLAVLSDRMKLNKCADLQIYKLSSFKNIWSVATQSILQYMQFRTYLLKRTQIQAK